MNPANGFHQPEVMPGEPDPAARTERVGCPAAPLDVAAAARSRRERRRWREAQLHVAGGAVADDEGQRPLCLREDEGLGVGARQGEAGLGVVVAMYRGPLRAVAEIHERLPDRPQRTLHPRHDPDLVERRHAGKAALEARPLGGRGLSAESGQEDRNRTALCAQRPGAEELAREAVLVVLEPVLLLAADRDAGPRLDRHNRRRRHVRDVQPRAALAVDERLGAPKQVAEREDRNSRMETARLVPVRRATDVVVGRPQMGHVEDEPVEGAGAQETLEMVEEVVVPARGGGDLDLAGVAGVAPAVVAEGPGPPLVPVGGELGTPGRRLRIGVRHDRVGPGAQHTQHVAESPSAPLDVVRIRAAGLEPAIDVRRTQRPSRAESSERLEERVVAIQRKEAAVRRRSGPVAPRGQRTDAKERQLRATL
jgi:hypothetical protein